MSGEAEQPFITSTAEALEAERRWVETLIQETDALRATKRYRAWLAATAVLWRYSPLNCCLVLLQNGATESVAGAREWERRGRKVREDARPLWILAPGGRRRFVGVAVYDVRHTDGPRVKPGAWRLEGGARKLERVEAAASRLGITLGVNTTCSGALGVCYAGRRVEVTPGLSRAERMATLVHEYAHALLGHAEPEHLAGRVVAVDEAEAEGTAWVVLKTLGARTKAPEYLAFNGVSTRALQRSSRRIGETAREILSAIEGTRRRVRFRGEAAPASRADPVAQEGRLAGLEPRRRDTVTALVQAA